jgi:hypothetical protein
LERVNEQTLDERILDDPIRTRLLVYEAAERGSFAIVQGLDEQSSTAEPTCPLRPIDQPLGADRVRIIMHFLKNAFASRPGDRFQYRASDDRLHLIGWGCVGRGGNVIIPTFALERAGTATSNTVAWARAKLVKGQEPSTAVHHWRGEARR